MTSFSTDVVLQDNSCSIAVAANMSYIKYYRYSSCSKPRVTISGKAKIGTMDGHFARDQIFGLIIFFLNKIGTSNSALDLMFEGGNQLQRKRKKNGVISKKKGHHLFGCTFCVIFRRKI